MIQRSSTIVITLPSDLTQINPGSKEISVREHALIDAR